MRLAKKTVEGAGLWNLFGTDLVDVLKLVSALKS